MTTFVYLREYIKDGASNKEWKQLNELLNKFRNPGPGKICPEYFVNWGERAGDRNVCIGMRITVPNINSSYTMPQKIDGESLTFAEYWRIHKKVRLLHPEWPLVNAEGRFGGFYPLELVKIKLYEEDHISAFQSLKEF